MADDQLVQAYAQAIYEQAFGRWSKALRALAAKLEETRDVLPRLDNPAESLDRKKELVNRLLPADADVEVRNFVYLLASKSQVHLLQAVNEEFSRYISRGPARQLARVTSAIQLTEDERTKLEQKARAQFGEDIGFEYRVDESLLGGVVLRVGDKVIDGSVAGKLAAMRHKLEATR